MGSNNSSNNSLEGITMNSPVGQLSLVADSKALVAVLWEKEKLGRVKIEFAKTDEPSEILRQSMLQLDEYFKGIRKTFSLPLNPMGTEFQKNVWTELLNIPFGRTSTYKNLAESMGKPLASRAVGTATGKNPLSIVVPCHRLIGSDGKLTGFAGGLDAKRYLLQLEEERA